MSAKKRKMFIYIALALAVIWGVYNYPVKNKIPPGNEKPETIQPLDPTSTEQPTGEMINIEKKTRAAWGADPFQTKHPISVTKKVSPQWRLSGIVYNNQTPLAIINNKPVRTGDIVNGARVVAIQVKMVTLEYNGTLFNLTVTKG